MKEIKSRWIPLLLFIICLTRISGVLLQGARDTDTLRIVTSPDAILKETAQHVEKIGPKEQELARLMINTMEKYRGNGLAAPQTGVSQRIIVVRLTGKFFNKEVLAMINPVIVERSEDIVYGTETCFSTTGSQVSIPRNKWVKVKFLTLTGEERVLIKSGEDARTIQHEIDHLNGILITDYQKA